jgi:hypothetical protein
MILKLYYLISKVVSLYARGSQHGGRKGLAGRTPVYLVLVLMVKIVCVLICYTVRGTQLLCFTIWRTEKE